MIGFGVLFLLFLGSLIFRPLLIVFIGVLILAGLALLFSVSSGGQGGGSPAARSFGGGGGPSRPYPSSGVRRGMMGVRGNAPGSAQQSKPANPNQNILMVIGAIIAFFLILFSS